MTGAGATTIAWAIEASFLGGVGGTPTWRQPGMNIEAGEPSLDRQMTRARHPDDPGSQGSREGNKRGSWNITFDLTDDDFHPLVFNEATNTELPSAGSAAPSAVWYVEVQTLNGTETRFLEGAVVESVSWNYQQGEAVSVDMSIAYADEIAGDDANSPATPSAISRPTKDDIVMWHDIDWTISAASVEKLQSLSVSVDNLYQLEYGQGDTATDAVTALQDLSLTSEAILGDATQRELAYGSAGATSTESEIAQTDTTITLTGASDLNANGVQPTNYSWAQLVAEESVTEPVEYHVEDLVVV